MINILNLNDYDFILGEFCSTCFTLGAATGF